MAKPRSPARRVETFDFDDCTVEVVSEGGNMTAQVTARIGEVMPPSRAELRKLLVAAARLCLCVDVDKAGLWRAVRP